MIAALANLLRTLARVSVVACIAACCVPHASAATPAGDDDTNKPVNIEADRGSYDDLKQLAVFTGNVVMTRGSLAIRADRVEVKQTPEGFQYGSAFGNNDRLATFRQKRPGLEQYIEGYGNRIDYDGQNDIVTLNQRAQMRRLEGGNVFDEISGHTITYNNRTDVYNVVSGASATNPGNPQGRVRATIVPRPRDDKSSAASPGSLPLRPASSIGDAAQQP